MTGYSIKKFKKSKSKIFVIFAQSEKALMILIYYEYYWDLRLFRIFPKELENMSVPVYDTVQIIAAMHKQAPSE